MGTYATTTTLDTLMVGVTFDTATTSLAGTCITQAETKVREFISKRYDLSDANFALTTTSTVPPIITTLCEWYSSGLLWSFQSRGGVESLSRGKELRDLATENLTSISKYEHDVLNAAGSVIADKGETAFRILDNTSPFTETFNEDDPLLWRVDKDKLKDIEDSRD